MQNIKYDPSELIYETITDTKHRLVALKGRRLRDKCEVGVRDASYYTQNGQTTRSYCIAQRTMSVSYEKP